MANRNLADVLERLAKVGRAHADGVHPVNDANGQCMFCYNTINDGEVREELAHEPWCAWVEGRKLSPSDIVAVERLARVLRYEV